MIHLRGFIVNVIHISVLYLLYFSFIFIVFWFQFWFDWIYVSGCPIPYPKREFLTDDDQDEKSENKRQNQQQPQQQPQQQTQQQQPSQSQPQSSQQDNHNPAKRVRLSGPQGHPGQINQPVRAFLYFNFVMTNFVLFANNVSRYSALIDGLQQCYKYLITLFLQIKSSLTKTQSNGYEITLYF